MILRWLLTSLTAGGLIVRAQTPLCADTFTGMGVDEAGRGIAVANDCHMLDFVTNAGVCSNYGAQWHSTYNATCSDPPEVFPPTSINYTGNGKLEFACSKISEPKSCPGNVSIFACCAHVSIPLSSTDGFSSTLALTPSSSSNTFGSVDPLSTDSRIPTVVLNTASLSSSAISETGPPHLNSRTGIGVILGATLGSIGVVVASLGVVFILIIRRRRQSADSEHASSLSPQASTIPFTHPTLTSPSTDQSSLPSTVVTPVAQSKQRSQPGTIESVTPRTPNGPSTPRIAGLAASLSDGHMIDRIIESIANRINLRRVSRQGLEDGLPPPDYRSQAG